MMPRDVSFVYTSYKRGTNVYQIVELTKFGRCNINTGTNLQFKIIIK